MKQWEVFAQQERAGLGVRGLVLSRIMLFAAALLFAIVAILPDPSSPTHQGPLGDSTTQAVFLDASGDDDKSPILHAVVPVAPPQPRFSRIEAFRFVRNVAPIFARHELERSHARGPPLA